MKILGVVLGCVLASSGCKAKSRAEEMFGSSETKDSAIKVNKYAYEGYPSWSASHPEKTCPDKLSDLNEDINGDDINDAWGHPIVMQCGQDMPSGAKGIAVHSLGPDGKDNTCDDIESWDPKHSCS